MAGANETGQKLLSANTAQDALTAVVDEIADGADFCLVLRMGRVPGADFEMVAVWDAATGPGYSGVPGRRIPYALLAPFFEVGRRGAAPEGAAGQAVLETAVVTDVGQDGRITPGFGEMLAATGARSFVAVPMGSGGET
ncbi:MAG TPA: hypothetical protein VLC95_11320, partial [Anaerolineae bacterium]|nr:hypothetical protein [Anaerolineae bacterium]